eukprot:scaffold12829_cov116-Isochrysis_galbana.AAC.2
MASISAVRPSVSTASNGQPSVASSTPTTAGSPSAARCSAVCPAELVESTGAPAASAACTCAASPAATAAKRLATATDAPPVVSAASLSATASTAPWPPEPGSVKTPSVLGAATASAGASAFAASASAAPVPTAPASTSCSAAASDCSASGAASTSGSAAASACSAASGDASTSGSAVTSAIGASGEAACGALCSEIVASKAERGVHERSVGHVDRRRGLGGSLGACRCRPCQCPHRWWRLFGHRRSGSNRVIAAAVILGWQRVAERRGHPVGRGEVDAVHDKRDGVLGLLTERRLQDDLQDVSHLDRIEIRHQPLLGRRDVRTSRPRAELSHLLLEAGHAGGLCWVLFLEEAEEVRAQGVGPVLAHTLDHRREHLWVWRAG